MEKESRGLIFGIVCSRNFC